MNVRKKIIYLKDGSSMELEIIAGNSINVQTPAVFDFLRSVPDNEAGIKVRDGRLKLSVDIEKYPKAIEQLIDLINELKSGVKEIVKEEAKKEKKKKKKLFKKAKDESTDTSPEY